MACIDCGLAENADGKGRVDIDTDGGLECHGTGPGGTTNTTASGIAVKVNGTAGNSLQVDSNGVYVPPAFRFENYYGTISGSSLADPGFGVGGGTFTTGNASISLANTTAHTKSYMYQGVFYYSSSDLTDPFWLELAVQEAGGGYQVPSAAFVATGSINSPLLMLPQAISVSPGETKQVDAKGIVYRGNMANWRVSIVAWGGYS
jgi:hypothetical protein